MLVSVPEPVASAFRPSLILTTFGGESRRLSEEEDPAAPDFALTPRSRHKRSRTAWPADLLGGAGGTAAPPRHAVPSETVLKPIEEEDVEILAQRSFSFLGPGGMWAHEVKGKMRTRLELHKEEIAARLEERKLKRLEQFASELKDILGRISRKVNEFARIGNRVLENYERTILFIDPADSNKVYQMKPFSGFSGTVPAIHYGTQIKQLNPPEASEISELLQTIFQNVQLPFECAIIALVYIERLIV